jgi:hypothetical protein
MKVLSAEVVAQKAIIEYQKIIEKIQLMEEFLEDKPFPMGSYIIKKKASYFDNVFGSSEGEIGKVIGWDFEYQYYRVYYSDTLPYIGTREDTIELYNGEVPDNIKNHDPYEVKRMMVRL